MTPTGWYVVAVCVFILVLDVAYVDWGTYRQPYADSQKYYAQSRLLIRDAGLAMPWLTRVLDRESFTEDPSVSPGWPATIRSLANQGFLTPVYMAGSQLVLGEGLNQARIANALLHVGDALLVWQIGTLMASPFLGLVSLTLFVLYIPYTYMASQLLTENLAAWLILWLVWLGIKALNVQERWVGVVTAGIYGLSLPLLAYTRPALAPLAAFMLAVWAGAAVWKASAKVRGPVLAGLVVAAACAIGPYFLWQQVVADAFGIKGFIFSTTGPRFIDTSLAESYDVSTRGWPRPSAFLGITGEFLPHDPPLESLREHPWETSLLRIEKFYRLWKGPATAYANPFWGTGNPVVDILHAVLVLAGCLGLLFCRPTPKWLLCMAPILYTSVLYTGFFSEERRFVFPVMGLAIVFAAMATVRGWERIQGRRVAWRSIRVEGVWVLGLVLSGAYLAANGFVVRSGGNAWWVHGIAASLLTASMALGLWRVVRFLWADAGSTRLRIGAVTAIGLLVTPVGVHAAHYMDWYTWNVSLRSPAQELSQTFVPPAGFDWAQVVAANLEIDARVPDGRLANLDVRVNGVPQTDLVRGDSMSFAYRYAIEDIAPLQPSLDWDQIDVAPNTPIWLFYKLDPHALANADQVVASVRLKHAPRSPEDAIQIFGELPSNHRMEMLGPRPRLLGGQMKLLKSVPFSGRNSLWRYQTYGDFRIHGGTWLEGDHTSAYLPETGAPLRTGPAADLSDAPLLQTGSYRIRLQLITRDGRELYF